MNPLTPPPSAPLDGFQWLLPQKTIFWEFFDPPTTKPTLQPHSLICIIFRGKELTILVAMALVPAVFTSLSRQNDTDWGAGGWGEGELGGLGPQNTPKLKKSQNLSVHGE